MFMSRDKTTLLNRRKELIHELCLCNQMLTGSIMEIYSTCSRPNCACHKGKKHGPRYYFSMTAEGKQRQFYVRQRNKSLVESGIKTGKRVVQIIHEISEINLQLIKEGAYDDGVE